jgi:hypothetical protein
VRGKGYADVARDDASPWNFVLGDDQGCQIDIHVISFFDEAGNGIYGPVENEVSFPAGSLTGQGQIDGFAVNCIAPEHLVKFHTGYELREKTLRTCRRCANGSASSVRRNTKVYEIRSFEVDDFERLKEICLLASTRYTSHSVNLLATIFSSTSIPTGRRSRLNI